METPFIRTRYFIHPTAGDDTNIGTDKDAPLKTMIGLGVAVVATENPWIDVCYWSESLSRYVEL